MTKYDMNMEKSYKEYLPQINTLIFDVDGVLTNGMVTVFPNGELVRHMNIKDGYALKTAVDAGLHVCIISGGNNEGVRKRRQHQKLMYLFVVDILYSFFPCLVFLDRFSNDCIDFLLLRI